MDRRLDLPQTTILKRILTQPNLNMQKRRWIEILHKYDFDIVYRFGKENVIADALSCNSILGIITTPNDPILALTRESTLNNPEYLRMLDLNKIGGEPILRGPLSQTMWRTMIVCTINITYVYREILP